MFESELVLEVIRCHENGRPERETGGSVRPILESGSASIALSGAVRGIEAFCVVRAVKYSNQSLYWRSFGAMSMVVLQAE